MGRKSGLKWATALALVAGATAAGAAHAADLTVAAFGGVWEKSLRDCTIAPFEKKTGKKVDVVLGSPVQWMNQIQASAAKPPIDVLFLPTENAIDAIQRGIIDKMTVEKVPNVAQLAPRFAQIGDGLGVVHNYGAMGLIYNKTTIKEKDLPKTWADFYAGTLAGKWKATMPAINYPSAGLTISVWQMATLHGGNIDNVQPAFDAIKKLRASGNMALWSDPNAVLNGLKSGDVDVAMYWDGRAWSFIDDGNKDFGYFNPQPGAVVAMTWIQKVKNGSDLSWEFMNQALSVESQSCFGSAIRYGVANTKATFDPKVAHEITKIDELVFPPFNEIPSRQAKWVETWNKEIR